MGIEFNLNDEVSKVKRQEYEKYLDEIEILISKGNITTEIIETMDKLYSYKPVSLRWHILKCRLLNKSQRYEEASITYQDMIYKESKASNNINLWNEYINSLELCEKYNEAEQHKFMQAKLLDNSLYHTYHEEIKNIKKEFVLGNESIEILTKMEELMFVCCQRLLAFLIYLYRVKLYPETEDKEKLEFYLSYENVEYLYECIQKESTAIIISEKQHDENYDILTYILNKLGLKVYFVGETVYIDGDYSLQDTVAVSMDNSEEYEDCIYIPPVANNEECKLSDTNITYIIDYICKNKSKDDFAFTFTSNKIIEQLRKNKIISKRFERLSRYDASYLENEIGFAWCGDYYTYISNLYKCNVRECVNRQPECVFSVVVPVRNATETLYYTLKTCIEQEYQGSYEIVLSDNSLEGDNNAYEIYKKLDSDLIKYYRTPRHLNLTKSYEYAYLQTRGKYIISIGADDALFPWSLSILANIWENEANKKRNIIRWDRGFYAWPGFNGGQENQLIIPAFYKKNDVRGHLNTTREYLMELKKNPSMMYALPNMYINSGFCRQYMTTMYNETGRLWDGFAQDIYSGAQNLMLNKELLYIAYPITIAGMSSSSMGALCTKNSNDSSVKCKKKVASFHGGKGIYAIIRSERANMVPEVGSDVSGIYLCIYYLMTKGILPNDYLVGDEEKNMFMNCYNSLSLHSDKYDYFINVGQYLASIRGQEMDKWFRENIAINREGDLKYLGEEIIQEIHNKKKDREGFDNTGGVVLDASRYGVSNIYEAVQLVKSFLGF